MTVAVDYIAAPFRELPPLGWRQLLEVRREVDPELRKASPARAWCEEWSEAGEVVRSWWQRYETAFGESWRRETELVTRRGAPFPVLDSEGEPLDTPTIVAGAEVLKDLPEEVWAHGIRLPEHEFRPELMCGDDDCEGTVTRTGSRGPLPKLCPYHREEHARERARARARKHRQAQRVLVRFESLSADGELRERTIANLDLDLERAHDDEAGRYLDARATWWVVNAVASPEWRVFAASENAAMAAAATA